MSGSDVAACMLTLSAATTALIVLARSGFWRLSYGLTLFTACAVIGQALVLWWPATFWTPEFCFAWDSCNAVLGAVAALELGRGVLQPARRVWGSVCRSAALLLLPLIVIGALGLATLSDAPRAGYRGLLAADTAVAGLLALVLGAVSLYELPREPLAVTALRSLLRYFALQVVYLGAWEAPIGWARAAGWLSTVAFAWSMLAIAVAALPPFVPNLRTAK